MKIINYNPKELEEWRILQQDGELVREHQDQKAYKKAKTIATWLCAINAIALLALFSCFSLKDHLPTLVNALVIINVMLFLSFFCAVIAVFCFRPEKTYGYQPERTFREWFHARASKYKVIAIDRLNKTGNSRLEIAFEKEDGSILKCISPFVTVIESAKYTEHTLDVSAGVMYIAYGANREPIEFVIPKKECEDG